MHGARQNDMAIKSRQGIDGMSTDTLLGLRVSQGHWKAIAHMGGAARHIHHITAAASVHANGHVATVTAQPAHMHGVLPRNFCIDWPCGLPPAAYGSAATTFR